MLDYYGRRRVHGHDHHSHILLFLAFTIHFKFPDVPAVAPTLLCFGEFLLRGFTAFKSVLNALASVRHFHVVHNYSTAGFDAPSVALWRRALPLTVRATPGGAPPFPLPLLQRICRLACSLGGGEGRVFAALLSITFYSLARISSLLPASGRTFDPTRLPTVADVRSEGTSFLLLLKWAKNRQHTEQGFWVPLLPCSGSPACPVTRLRDLLSLLQVSPPPPPFSPSPLQGGPPPATRQVSPSRWHAIGSLVCYKSWGRDRAASPFIPYEGGLAP